MCMFGTSPEGSESAISGRYARHAATTRRHNKSKLNMAFFRRLSVKNSTLELKVLTKLQEPSYKNFKKWPPVCHNCNIWSIPKCTRELRMRGGGRVINVPLYQSLESVKVDTHCDNAILKAAQQFSWGNCFSASFDTFAEKKRKLTFLVGLRFHLYTLFSAFLR